MADQLQFRGGTTSEVSAASVASREIIIDTQTDEIAVGTSKKRTVMQESNGDVLIGGTLPSAPNITLAASGDITAGKFNEVQINKVGTGNFSLGINNFTASLTGINNLVFGANALRLITSGSNNAFIGAGAGNAITEGGSNTALGTLALNTTTTGNNNTAIGQNALTSNITGNKNAALGFQSGYYIEGSNNTILGAYKGTTADATLNSTVIISVGDTERARCHSTGIWNLGTSAPVYADNAAAKTGGLVDGDVYRKSDGTLMIVFT